MADYGQEYNPDAKTSYSIQLAQTDRVAKRLMGEVADLKESLSGESALNRKDISNKHDHLKASCSVYTGVRRFCKMMDIHLEEKHGVFDELDEEDNVSEEKKKEMEDVYNQMTRLLHVFETRMKAIVQAPNSWFTKHLVEVKKWIQQNPKLALGLSSAAGAAGGGALAVANYYNGYCLIYSFFYGSSCTCTASTTAAAGGSWGLAASGAIGASIGFLAVGLVVVLTGCAIKCYNDRSVKDETSEALKSIDAMVKKLKNMNQDDIIKQLKELHTLCDKAVGADIPQLPKDQICVICRAQGSSVKQPTKAPRCKGQHYMCKDCWLTSLATSGDKCPCCRV
eukprot:TRINITY_DN6982_c0_g2_i1.p1 TRINITY_DN6982_c0_g2~~TRINITY_DN6982_c0_g2_i1.p1  ORF type:complete len:361 (+),score=62.26 TRINITY_DN6982_c0_g2_i1:70-1083(+)